MLPWMIAACVNHAQIFVHLINWTSLICLVFVSVICSLIMWTRQLEETLVHESNFRETVKILVVQDKAIVLGDEGQSPRNLKARNLRDSESDSDGIDMRDKDSDTDPLLCYKNQDNEPNMLAAMIEKDQAKMNSGQHNLALSTAATNIQTNAAPGAQMNTSLNE